MPTVVHAESGLNLTHVLTQDEIDEKAWKYTGYRGFTNFVASDPDFFVVRRFDTLNARVLLTLQDHLSALEERLSKLDEKYYAKSAEDVNNGSIRDDQSDRAALTMEICDKLKDYSKYIFASSIKLPRVVSPVIDEIDEILLAHSELRSRGPASAHIISNVNNWFHNNDGAIMEEERRFITHKEDLINVTNSDKASMRRFLETHIVFRFHWLWKKDLPSDIREVDRKVRRYADDNRIDFITTIALSIIGMLMLIAPIWILAAIKAPYTKLGVITAFIVIFLVTVSYATVAKPSETLAATAAYSAVLMVFLQLGNADSSSPG
ncbi:uncharacterized protein GGS22DRAFT_196164 [Annulohypoxylon maeteangense]|uniref:uncharacterized protein n=1 Tax=Annulohypoxylon maeteangense TaxID=1927788 RepID=UPI002008991F|nr:uncharacterized protein GGS22DRAFT_196164 [Annulohypoxylon maeteangense]KAI0882000.1 hypothetical protein GGS22DRAFT_196164 [Annulohypoxylon maeteangense]